MPEARTPCKFTRSNARDAPGKMTLEKVGPDSHTLIFHFPSSLFLVKVSLPFLPSFFLE